MSTNLFCLIVVVGGGGGGGVRLQILEKNPRVHLTIIREWPKSNNYPILRSLDSVPLGAYYLTPLPPLLGTKKFILKFFLVEWDSF